MKKWLLTTALLLIIQFGYGQVKEKITTMADGGEVGCTLPYEVRPRWPVDTWYGVPEQVKRAAADRAMLRFISERLHFKNLGCIAGTIVVQFTVEPDGRITAPKIVRSLYPALDEQILEIVASFPRFVPGQQNFLQEDGSREQRPVKTLFTLPIKIRLE